MSIINPTLPVEEFKEACEDRGYTRISVDRGVLVVYTNNNIKHIKLNHIEKLLNSVPVSSNQSNLKYIKKTITDLSIHPKYPIVLIGGTNGKRIFILSM